MIKIFEDKLNVVAENKTTQVLIIVSVIAFVLTIICLLMIMYPLKTSLLPTGADYLQMIQNRNSEFDKKWKFSYQEVLLYSKLTDKQQKVNTLKIKLMMSAYLTAILMIVVMCIGM